MGRRPSRGKTASWDGLYELAADQGGYFSTSQAVELGFTTARLQHHVNVGKLVRESRGVLRLQQFPTGQFGEYIVLWLWSGREGVFSHETALMIHELSDAMPARFYMTLPESWSTRRLRVPAELVVHFADVPAADRTWKEHVPLTSLKRTIEDCIRDGTSPELFEHALTEARERGLVSSDFAKRVLGSAADEEAAGVRNAGRVQASSGRSPSRGSERRLRSSGCGRSLSSNDSSAG